MGIDGCAHDAATLEVEGNIDGLPIQAIELGDGIAGGGVEAEGEHGQISSWWTQWTQDSGLR
jgi:hypothetical protein